MADYVLCLRVQTRFGRDSWSQRILSNYLSKVWAWSGDLVRVSLGAPGDHLELTLYFELQSLINRELPLRLYPLAEEESTILAIGQQKVPKKRLQNLIRILAISVREVRDAGIQNLMEVVSKEYEEE